MADFVDGFVEGCGVTVRPSGTVTFLFTDVEGSTRLWAADSDAMSASLQVHDRILRWAIESFGGYVFTTAGDSFAAAFARASDAVAAAAQAQRELAGAAWGSGPALRVRMGMHTGEAEGRGGDYYGPAVNRAARVSAAGHGGQILMGFDGLGQHLPITTTARHGRVGTGEGGLVSLYRDGWPTWGRRGLPALDAGTA